MLVNVPQYIDVEDKIAGPLTAKQLGWMFAMGAVLLVCWSIFDSGAFIMIAILVVLIFVALAFYKPNGKPLIAFIGSSIFFLFRPKVYVWKREVKKVEPKLTNKEKTGMDEEKASRSKGRLDVSDLAGYAQVLDTEGMEKSERIAELLQKKNLSKK